MSKKITITIILAIISFIGIFIVGRNIQKSQDIRKKASNLPNQFIVTQSLTPSTLACNAYADIAIDVLRTGGTVTQTAPVDIVLAIDNSRSMISAGGNPAEPLHSAKLAAKNFVNLLNLDGTNTGDRVGLVTYSTSSQIVSGLSSDKNQILADIDAIDVDMYTNTAAGLSDSIEILETNGRSTAKQVIILLSDGLPNRNRTNQVCTDWPVQSNICTQDVVAVSDTLSQSDISVFTIGLGFDAINAQHPGSGDFGKTVLQSIATSDTYYYEAPTHEQLSSIYQSIANIINNIVVSATLHIDIANQLHLDQSSISPVPDSITANSITWTLPQMSTDEVKRFTLKISNNQAQTIEPILSSSRLTYVEYDTATRNVSWTTSDQLTTTGAQCLNITNTMPINPSSTPSQTPSPSPSPTETTQVLTAAPTPTIPDSTHTPTPILINPTTTTTLPSSTPTLQSQQTNIPTTQSNPTPTSLAISMPESGFYSPTIIILLFSFSLLAIGLIL